MFNTQEKRERALGTKLFLKAHRCNSVKCVMTRKPFRPGMHGQARHTVSEVGTRLNEKQKIKVSYGLREAQLRKIVDRAMKNPGVTGQVMVELLERRLDNVVYRLGIAPSRSVARQLVGHGHITVDGRRTTIPSYLIGIGDKIGIRKESKDVGPLKDIQERVKNYNTPVWLQFNPDTLEGNMVSLPKDVEVPFDVNSVVDYYSNKK
ncbi:MAG: 30S ribosomal protein S4 [bacterium]|nr:30S ribosomal protein S4 [bacterium]